MKLLFDFFPILLFFVAYKLYGIYTATAVAIAASFVQVGLFWFKHRRFENMHLVTLAVITVFGGATLVLENAVFIQWKPTVVNWLFGAVFLASQFIGEKTLVERMLSGNITLPARIWTRLNLSWSIFFVIQGFANLYVVYNFDENTWVNFKLFGMMGLTIAFIVVQGFFIARYIKPENDLEGEQ